MIRSKIAAVTVLYNPDLIVIKNIQSYITQIDTLYIIDNSTNHNEEIETELSSLSNVSYSRMPRNLGIATALNIACKQALKDGYSWILTMDQDSFVSETMLGTLYSFTSNDDIAIISPYHASKFYPLSSENNTISERTTVMTSGNLLNLHLYSKIGPFDDKLFIDFVDHDYCLRARQHGYKIIQINQAVLKHNLGNLRQYKLTNLIFHSTNHPPIRKYYIFRNRAYIIQKYRDDFPIFCKRELHRFLTDIIVVIFFENQKIEKLKMMYLGLKDFFQGKAGAFNA